MGVNSVEIQRLSPLLNNINPNKRLNRAKPSARDLKNVSSGESSGTGQSDRADTGQEGAGEVLISVSNTIADSNGMDLSGRHLSFAVDSDTGATVINIVDSGSGEVIKQIPPEGLLDLRKKMGEIQGLLLDKRA